MKNYKDCKDCKTKAIQLGMLHAKHMMKEDHEFNDGVLHGAGFWNHFVHGLKKGIESSAKIALPVIAATNPELAPIAIAGEVGMEALKGSGNSVSKSVSKSNTKQNDLFEWAL